MALQWGLPRHLQPVFRSKKSKVNSDGDARKVTSPELVPRQLGTWNRVIYTACPRLKTAFYTPDSRFNPSSICSPLFSPPSRPRWPACFVCCGQIPSHSHPSHLARSSAVIDPRSPEALTPGPRRSSNSLSVACGILQLIRKKPSTEIQSLCRSLPSPRLSSLQLSVCFGFRLPPRVAENTPTSAREHVSTFVAMGDRTQRQPSWVRDAMRSVPWILVCTSG